MIVLVYGQQYIVGRRGAYLGIVDKDHDDCVSRNLLNSIQISQRINLIKASIPANTRTRPPVPNIISLSLQLLPSLLSPSLYKLLLFTRASLTIIPQERTDPLILIVAIAYPRRTTCSGNLTPPPILRLTPSRLLETPRIGNDALDARGAAIVEVSVREEHGPAAGVEGRHAHIVIDLLLEVGLLFVLVLSALVRLVVLVIFTVVSVVCDFTRGRCFSYDGIEFFLCGGFGCHFGRRVGAGCAEGLIYGRGRDRRRFEVRGQRSRKDVVRQIERGLNTKGEIEQKQKKKKGKFLLQIPGGVWNASGRRGRRRGRMIRG